MMYQGGILHKHDSMYLYTLYIVSCTDRWYHNSGGDTVGDKSTYKGFTEARARANKKYLCKFQSIQIRLDKPSKDTIKAHADRCGESVNGFINRAISETMQRDLADGTDQ